MRNDEKINIQLENVSEEDMTPEERAQQNYNTALRYINIAEHMNQFEDQDKYYRRAIRYLRRCRPYIKVRRTIRQLRKKKFNARAEGKIALYAEACHIRDKAQTPEDYYAAQTIFDRIHRYEQTHKIPRKRVTAEQFEKLKQCADSGQQAINCGLKAEELAARHRRRGIIISVIVIAAILAFLLFTRTMAFRWCLSEFSVLTGDYSSAWGHYSRIYELNGSETALEKYQVNRYKAAEKEIKEESLGDARKDFYALALEGYEDSEERLLSLEQEIIVNTELGEKVKFGDRNWRVLDFEDEKALLILDDAISGVPFQEDDTVCTWETSSARAWLNSDFLEDGFLETELSAICETTVTADENPTYHTPAGNDTVDQVYLLSDDEAAQYYDVLHDTKTSWWLRTPGVNKKTMSFVYRDRTVMDYGYTTASSSFTLKPVIWVSLSEE